MNRYRMFIGALLAWTSLAACAGTLQDSAKAVSSVQPISPPREFADAAFRWRQEARELRRLADRHDAEIRVLSQSRALLDQKLVERRRVLVQQLRAAAEQAEQRAEEAQEQVPHGMVQ
ncbi:MAG: hypothetical protein OJF47_004190 [Nitrospira sp.]|jgi:hypothetical protein|nr:MAG: hypothetical protein OJF47_004190 [Nitrospira sp.]